MVGGSEFPSRSGSHPGRGFDQASPPGDRRRVRSGASKSGRDQRRTCRPNRVVDSGEETPMKRSLLLFFFTAATCFAQEPGAEGGESLGMWRWINFAILAVGILYLLGKNM